MHKGKDIIPYSHPVKNMKYNTPEAPANATSKVVTELNNSWNNCCFLDDRGQIWIEISKLNSILRTNKSNANYYVAQIKEENKIRMNNKTYTIGYEVIKLIDKFIQNENSGSKKSMYLKYSENLYHAIRDSDTSQNLRNTYQLMLSDNRKKLKKIRTKKYKIKFDELTGEPLKRIKSEFSHIRSFAIFKELGDRIENGLIVNRDTHQIITKAGINDEDELLDLCKEHSWKTNWYDNYLKFLKTIE